MNDNSFYSYLHKQIPVMMVLSLFPGLAYVLLAWLHDIQFKGFIWYALVVVVSLWGYSIYKEYLANDRNSKQLKIWYRKLSWFYYVIFALWLLVFLLFISEKQYNLHYIAIFTEIGASVVASILLIPDKKLFKPNIIMLMVPLMIYFVILGDWHGYVLAVFSATLAWVLIYSAGSSHKLLMQTNYQANHDYLTGLKNRFYFINYLQSALSSLQAGKSYTYLLLIDLDHFKTINDSLGHDIGDHLLQDVSNRIKEYQQENTLLARLGGDEFVILGSEYSNKESCREDAQAVANKILQGLKESYTVELHNLYISASIGVSLLVEEYNDASRLIKEADIAMYEAKEKGRDGVIVFDDDMAQRIERNLEIERLLHFSIENDEISLVFQPQLDIRQQVIGAETLTRWENKKLGAISPETFIAIAEQTGFIIELGRYILESAFRALGSWDKQGISLDQFSINVSMRQLFYNDFVDDVKLLCEEYLTQEMRNKIVFEVTESIIAEDVDKVISIMKSIKQLGIRFSMDDFGTGYSSLSYLKRLPIDEIKIDRSFIADLNQESSDQIMVNSILNMANQFSLSVVAEGVETEQQFAYLKANKCDCYQGYYFSVPLAEQPFVDFYLKNNNK
ncbi:MAG: EAL domain-containing protein [Gammaproteobacteria bacterium]|nr:EAL domain-containing protein [Gammaproteobacteria bacterium]